MPGALPKENDLVSSAVETLSTSRSYFLALINANDRRSTDALASIKEWVQLLVVEKGLRYEQQFTSQQLAVETAFAAQEVLVNKMTVALKEQLLSVIDEKSKTYEAKDDSVNRRIEHLYARMDLASTKGEMEDHEEISRVREQAIFASIQSVRDGINTALVSAKEAVTKSEVASEKRFDSVNEFRNTLADQQRSLIPRQEVDVIVKSLEDKISTMSTLLAGQDVRIGALIASQTGHKEGVSQGWGYVVGVIGAVLAIISIINLVSGVHLVR